MIWKTFICVILCLNFVRADDLIVQTLNGKVRGRMEYSLRKPGVPFYAFQQIPYGKAPVGHLRFKEPQPVNYWWGVLDATKNTKTCYQVQNFLGLEKLQTEDCLFLNVYTPKKPVHQKNLPVLVWIYGGGFITGSSNFDISGPHYLMENEVIVVSINYRLGAFGFLATDDLSSPGNYGLKDQRLALKWIQNNIEYFGGDPNKVTIMGTSAGAASVTYHFMNPRSKGLFWAGIAGSGSLLTPWAYQKDSKAIAYKLAKAINPSFNPYASTAELVAYLRSVPADVLNNASATAVSETVGNEQIVQGYFYAPVIEPKHRNAFITENMYTAVEQGKMNQVPLLMGIESEEGLARALDPNWTSVLPILDNDVKLLVNHNMRISCNKTLDEVGQKIREIVTNGLLQNNHSAAIRYFSDMSFNRPLIRHGELQSKFSDVYFYQFSYDGKLGLGGIKNYVEGADRVLHSEDTNYFLTSGNRSNLDTYDPEDILTSDRWRLLLTNFAKYRNPTPEESKILQNITWPKVQPNNFVYLNLNNSLSIVQDHPKSNTYFKWVELYEQYARKPYINF
ncbi:venom carboxylesterase-6 isoform X1 [Diabrotica virgifera virgifera]|uniref:Carboxylic ester hydrolase n=1 Tax=Diabrotica virgifera virgifera TaxID=50390 RepID=A0ABM5IJR9_DIAVI|nr:venom carboxylesterase-6 isoform X1 [Diabrotica virgifera virgifera]